VLPPLLANAAVGAILYTSYLQILGALHGPSSQSSKRIFPPPSPGATFTAGVAAGGIQSFVAAPLDALQIRFKNREKHYENKSMWAYGKGKLKDIGMRGIFAGWGLSFLKDSLGSGIFFCVFEYVKAQSYYRFVATYYGQMEPWVVTRLSEIRGVPSTSRFDVPIIKPHYVLEPGFLMLAGVAASISQQGIIYPLAKVQTMHYERLEDLDKRARMYQRSRSSGRMMRAYYHAYQETWRQCKVQAQNVGTLRKWLFRGFWWSSIKQTPATSAGLVVFELVRRRYGIGNEEVKINEDGYDILLS
jgi:Mitochondrial carrier protein